MQSGGNTRGFILWLHVNRLAPFVDSAQLVLPPLTSTSTHANQPDEDPFTGFAAVVAHVRLELAIPVRHHT
jgi:hypothetical protein